MGIQHRPGAGHVGVNVCRRPAQVGVLRAAEAELASREAKAHGGGISKDSLAARVQVGDRHR